ncbi:hypothetical protein [Streptomyces sp. NPDC002853]
MDGIDAISVMDAVHEALRHLWRRQIIVALAGPAEIAVSSDALCREHAKEAREIEEIRDRIEGAARPPKDARSQEQRETGEARWVAHLEFIDQARKALGTDKSDA